MPPSPHPDEEVFGKAYDGRLVRRLLSFIRPYGRGVLLAIVMLILLTLLELAGPPSSSRPSTTRSPTADLERLDLYALQYLAVVIGIFGLRYGQNYLLNRAGQLAMHDLRVALFSHIQRLSLSFFDRNPVGRLMSRLTNDVDSLNELLTSGGLAILSDAVTIVGIAVALVLLSWQLALVTFLVIPPLLILTTSSARACASRSERCASNWRGSMPRLLRTSAASRSSNSSIVSWRRPDTSTPSIATCCSRTCWACCTSPCSGRWSASPRR